MQTIAQELELYTAIHDKLCIEVPKKDLADNELSKAFYDDNDANVFVFLEQTEKELKLVYSFNSEENEANEALCISRVGFSFYIRCSLKEFDGQPYLISKDLAGIIYDKIFPAFYKNVQYSVEQEREESGK